MSRLWTLLRWDLWGDASGSKCAQTRVRRRRHRTFARICVVPTDCSAIVIVCTNPAKVSANRGKFCVVKIPPVAIIHFSAFTFVWATRKRWNYFILHHGEEKFFFFYLLLHFPLRKLVRSFFFHFLCGSKNCFTSQSYCESCLEDKLKLERSCSEADETAINRAFPRKYS